MSHNRNLPRYTLPAKISFFYSTIFNFFKFINQLNRIYKVTLIKAQQPMRLKQCHELHLKMIPLQIWQLKHIYL